ncbi:transposase [Escherichia coli]
MSKLSVRGDSHDKKQYQPVKKPRKQHSPEFRSEALKLAERIGVTAAARELSLYESQLYNWRSKQQKSADVF